MFLREGPRATSSLELAAGKVKNRRELAFDIPPEVARMLIEYRNRIAPKVIGHRPDRLFVRADGCSEKPVVRRMADQDLSQEAGRY